MKKHLALLLVLLTASVSIVLAYEPYIGTTDPADHPSWSGFGEIDQPNPTFPPEWTGGTTSVATGWFYVDKTVPGATNSGNPNGHPGAPRLTPPENLLAPGDKVYIHAGTYGALDSGGDRWGWHGPGTAANPIWVFGNPVTNPIFEDDIHIAEQGDVSFFILSDIQMSGVGTNIIDIRTTPLSTSATNIIVRNCRFIGTGSNLDGTAMTGRAQDGTTDVVEHIVWYNNKISDNGVHNSGAIGTSDGNDEGGIDMGKNMDFVWILDNEIYRVGSDSVSGCHTCSAAERPTNVTIAGNLMYENDENALDFKGIQKMVISQNEMYGPFNDDSGNAVVLHGGAQSIPVEDCWVIFNEIHDCPTGSWVTAGARVHHVGNVFYNTTSQVEAGQQEDQLNGAVIAYRGITANSGINYVVNNTIYSYEAGFMATNSGLQADIRDNLFINRITAANRYDYAMTSGDSPNITSSNNNYHVQTPALFNDSALRTIAQMQGNYGLEIGSSQFDPQFVAPGSDFNLQATSPVIDQGSLSPAYAAFAAEYPGRSIEFDFNGNSRTSGVAPDIGAFEFGALPPGDCVITTNARLPQGWASAPWTYTIGATTTPGIPVFTVISGALPPVMTLSTSGTLSGTPAAIGNYSFTIRATDSTDPTCFDDKVFSFLVGPPCGRKP